MDPTFVQIWDLGGRFGWSVDFADGGLDQEGKADTYAEALRCVAQAVDNAKEGEGA